MRLVLISDIHEDIENLQKLIEKADKKGYDKLICLGDISGYSHPHYDYDKERNASACLALIREKCEIIIAGNHDLFAAKLKPELTGEIQACETWQHEHDLDPGYSQNEISFLSSLPRQAIVSTPSLNILFTHYAYPNVSGYVKGFYTREREFDPHFLYMKQHKCSLAFTGHAHPRGFYVVHLHGYKHYRYRRIKLRASPSLVGIPPVTRNKHRSGFCIFDTESMKLQVLK